MTTTFAVLFAGAALRSTTQNTSDKMLLPGDGGLVTSHFGTDSAVVRVVRNDSTGLEKEISRTFTIERKASDSGNVFFYSQFAAYHMTDSLVFREKGLAPQYEKFVRPTQTSTYEFAGSHVHMTIEKPNSPATTTDVVYPQPVFAFSQVETIARSLPYRAGYKRILPLFSVGDNTVEYDTISVVGKTPTASGGAVWNIRFADRSIVKMLTVDEKTRRLVEQDVTMRSTGVTTRNIRM